MELGGLQSWNLEPPHGSHAALRYEDDGPQLNNNRGALADPACQEKKKKKKIIGTGFLDPPIGIPEAAAAAAVPARLLRSDLKDASERFFQARIWHLLPV